VLSTLTPLEAHHVPPDLRALRPRRSVLRPWRISLLQRLQRHWAGPGPGGRHLRLDQRRHLPPLGRRLEQASQGGGHLEDARPGWLLRVDVISLEGAAVGQSAQNALDPELEFVQAMTPRDL
jgi:hypothetical protein